nr:DUF1214 domain-containing protein [Acidisphaera sp. S103]
MDANRYTVIFAKDATPPVNGFLLLLIYNEHHFFIKNAINRFSVGTKNKDLQLAADGSLTAYVQSDPPTDPAQRANWLPAPKGDFSLYVRAYWPKSEITDGSWTPPPVIRESGFPPKADATGMTRPSRQLSDHAIALAPIPRFLPIRTLPRTQRWRG